MEETVISFNYNSNLNNQVFYSKVWPSFCKFIDCNTIKCLTIDLTSVKFISPLILPKLCAMGCIARKKGKIISLEISANSSVKYYLAEVGFFDIIKKHDIIFVDDGFTGGAIDKSGLTYSFSCFEKESLIKKYTTKYEFDERLKEEDLLKFCIYMEIFGDYNEKFEVDNYTINKSSTLKILKEFCKDYKKIKEIAMIFAEIIHNSVWHGNGLCFFSLQAGWYSNFAKVEISIADNGVGLYKTLINKDWKKNNKTLQSMPIERFLKLLKREEQCYYSIIETLLYRKSESLRGMYDILELLAAKKNPSIEIVNNNYLFHIDKVTMQTILKGDYRNINKGCCIGEFDHGYILDVFFNI